MCSASSAAVALLREALPWCDYFDSEPGRALSEKLHALALNTATTATTVVQDVFGPTSDLPESSKTYFSAWIGNDPTRNRKLVDTYVEFLESQPGPVYLDLCYWIHCPRRLPKNLGWVEYESKIIESLYSLTPIARTGLTDRNSDYVVSRAFSEELYVHKGRLVTLDTFCRLYRGEYPLSPDLFESWSVERRTSAYDTLFHKLEDNVFRYFGGTCLFGHDKDDRLATIPCAHYALRVELFAYYRFMEKSPNFELPLDLDQTWHFLGALKRVSATFDCWFETKWCRPITKESLLDFALAFGEKILSDDSKRELGVSLFEQLASVVSADVVRRLLSEWCRPAPEIRPRRASQESIWSLVSRNSLETKFRFLLTLTRGDRVSWGDYLAVEARLPGGSRRTVELQACLLELFDRVDDDSIDDAEIQDAIDWELDQRHVSRRDLLRRIREPHTGEISRARETLRARVIE